MPSVPQALRPHTRPVLIKAAGGRFAHLTSRPPKPSLSFPTPRGWVPRARTPPAGPQRGPLRGVVEKLRGWRGTKTRYNESCGPCASRLSGAAFQPKALLSEPQKTRVASYAPVTGGGQRPSPAAAEGDAEAGRPEHAEGRRLPSRRRGDGRTSEKSSDGRTRTAPWLSLLRRGFRGQD